ncbi:MAG: hypothetical protein ACREUE_06090, partial [Panacagrimonas sp.]
MKPVTELQFPSPSSKLVGTEGDPFDPAKIGASPEPASDWRRPVVGRHEEGAPAQITAGAGDRTDSDLLNTTCRAPTMSRVLVLGSGGREHALA